MSVNTHQFPRTSEVFLDHAAIFVDEFDRSGHVLQRLGFTMTPFRAHSSALRPGDPITLLGTGNRCAMLREGFIEVLGPTSDTPMAAQLRASLARYPGLHLIAFSGTDPQARHAALVAAGLAPAPIARIERTQASSDGDQDIRASIVRLKPDAWPEGRVQMVFPEMSPDKMWHPSLVQHPNAADRLCELLLVVENPSERARQFALFCGRAIRTTGPMHVLDLDRGRLCITDKRGLERVLPGATAPTLPFIAAAAIGSADLAVTREFFERQGIEFRAISDSLHIRPIDALGANLVFHDRPDGRTFEALSQA